MLEMGILYEALCGSDSVCKGSNPFTAAKRKQTSARVSVFSSIEEDKDSKNRYYE